MDNQFVTPEIEGFLKRTAIIALVVFLIGFLINMGIHQLQIADPYIRNVLELTGNPSHGSEIFQMNCAGCHIRRFNTQVGPNLQGISQRKSEIDLIHQVIGGNTPPMPQFQPTAQEMADLLEYLQQL